MTFTAAESRRFEAKFTVSPKGCWTWNGPLDRDGYGSFFFRRLNRRAHRVAWWNARGDIPDGFVINHTCRNRACVNPQHLQCVSVTDNTMKDSTSVAYINSQKTHCPQGHPYDRRYGKQRYCSICEAAKRKRLRKKWAEQDDVMA